MPYEPPSPQRTALCRHTSCLLSARYAKLLPGWKKRNTRLLHFNHALLLERGFSKQKKGHFNIDHIDFDDHSAFYVIPDGNQGYLFCPAGRHGGYRIHIQHQPFRIQRIFYAVRPSNIEILYPVHPRVVRIFISDSKEQETGAQTIRSRKQKTGCHLLRIHPARRGMYSVFTSHADKIVLTNMGTSRGESSFDKELFAPYCKALDDKAGKKLIIVHILGAHPAYNYRYPEEYNKFNISTDDAVTKELASKGRSKIAIVFRNQYDNAILYQDFILSTLLEKLQEKKLPYSAWLYISDHGQDVSRNTDFSGHNYLAKEMWEVPMLFWSSKDFLKHDLIPSLSTPYQADVIDHTILGLLDISGIYYNPSQDIFNTKPEKD